MTNDAMNPGPTREGAVEAAVGIVAAAAVSLSVPTRLAADASVLGVRLEDVSAYETQRANLLFARLFARDKHPEEFAQELRDHLRVGDAEVSAVLRTMLIAALDALTPAAIEPMAVLARRFLRTRDAPVWLVRGGLRTLAECSAVEFGALQQLMGDLAAFVAANPYLPGHPMRRFGVFVDQSGLAEIPVRSASAARPKRNRIAGKPGEHRRLFRLLKTHGLADEASDAPSHVPSVDAIGLEVGIVWALNEAVQAES